ncbi:hypothetical protein K431DRAFT_190758, partial [Polychaeton citri CBS 116435]
MIHGEKFELDLGSDVEAGSSQPGKAAPVAAPFNFVADVLERTPSAPKPPTAPTPKTDTGFPAHRKRDVKSRFRQRQQPGAASASAQPSLPAQAAPTPNATTKTDTGDAPSGPRSWFSEEKARIDRENSQKLANMSAQEIEEERAELLSSLSPALLQKLLAQSSIDSGSNESSTLYPSGDSPPKTEPQLQSRQKKRVAFQAPAPERAHLDDHEDEDDGTRPAGSIHFPRPAQPPSLDPNSASFLDDLHEKYFPSLPSDPEKLEWMRDSTPAKNTYDPSASALNPNEIRFAFSGQLIPPRSAAGIPVTEGLHHHGDAPDAAGYTIPELAHLARSSYPAQRCIAFQTLGRLLYRLGKGEFGDPGEPGANTVGVEDTFGELARGLWREVEMLQVVETLIAESEGNGVDKGRHVSAKAYATEAVWLWRKGGGRRWKA